MTVAVIAAMARNYVIGRGNSLPWHLPADLRRFKALTMGHTLLMGRTTFDSIGRPLAGRRTIVLTRRPGWSAPGVEVAHSLDEAFARAGPGPLFVAGGADVYRQTVDRAHCLYLTVIDRDLEGDAFFPRFDWSRFRVREREAHVDNDPPFEFVTLERTP